MKSVEVGGEGARLVQLLDRPEALSGIVQNPGAELELPERRERAALVVVVQTDEVNDRRLTRLWTLYLGRQPLPLADANQIARPEAAVRRGAARGAR